MSARTKPFCRLKVFGTRWASHDPTTVTRKYQKVRGVGRCTHRRQRSFLVMEPMHPAPGRGCHRCLTPHFWVLPLSSVRPNSGTLETRSSSGSIPTSTRPIGSCSPRRSSPSSWPTAAMTRHGRSRLHGRRTHRPGTTPFASSCAASSMRHGATPRARLRTRRAGTRRERRSGCASGPTGKHQNPWGQTERPSSV